MFFSLVNFKTNYPTLVKIVMIMNFSEVKVKLNGKRKKMKKKGNKR